MDQAPAKQRKTVKTGSANIKETIESILVAFILAFVFRAFVVEAFVIPTGSMATTLLGAHIRQACQDCGHRFTVNYSAPGGDEALIRSPVRIEMELHCPNCGYRTSPAHSQHEVHHGDRILVLKYLYLLQDPQRWDVVVFKSPVDPEKHDYQQNYIKRLIGLPGETLMILDGDIYVKDGERWTVQSKPRTAQDALWRLVYNNDQQPQADSPDDLRRMRHRPWKQPWRQTSGDGWTVDHQVFRFAATGGESTIEFDRAANPETHSLTEWLVYDARELLTQADVNQLNHVSDLKLDLYYARQQGEGPLRLMLTKLDQTFIAEILPDRVRLLQEGQEQPLDEVMIKGDRPMRVEFSNVDYRLTVRVDDRDLIVHSYEPDVEYLLRAYRRSARHALPPPRVRISAAEQQAALSHIRLYRDIYYANSQNGPSIGLPKRAGPNAPVELFDGDVVLGGGWIEKAV